MDMISRCILVSFVLHLGVMLQASEVTYIDATYGQEVTLPCQIGSVDSKVPVIWKYKSKEIIKYQNGKLLRVPSSSASSASYLLKNAQRGDYSLMVKNGEEGQYTCEAAGKKKTTTLTLWSVKGPLNEYLLEGDTTQLELSSSDTSTQVDWFGPKSKITGKKARWTLQNKNRKLQIKNLKAEEDQGTWECLISRGLRITHDVKVIGFVNSLDAYTRYAAVNSTVVLSCELNIDFQEIPKSMLRNPVLRWMNGFETIVQFDLNNFNSSVLQHKIDKVQFEHAGEYKCSIGFTQRNLTKATHLVVMKVSADRSRLDSKENVTLCCHISAPNLSKAQLCWNNGRDSPKCETHLPEGKFCYGTRTAGEWNCSLMVQDEEKLSMIYFVDEDSIAQQNLFPLIYIAIGAGVMLLLLIIIGVCVFNSKTVKQKRQRTRRMAQARQHLLEKKTCQCHKYVPEHSANTLH